jgi:hypothetical protein
VGFLIGLRRPDPHMQPVRPVEGHIGDGQRDELGPAVRASEPHQQDGHVPAGGDPGRPIISKSSQVNHQRPHIVQQERGPPDLRGGPDPPHPDNARRTTRPGRVRQAGGGVELVDRRHHRVNVAGAYRHFPTPVCSAAASVT